MKKEIDGKLHYQNAQGAWVPEELVKPQDLLKDDLVTEIVSDYLECREKTLKLKRGMKSKIDDFIELLGARYGVKTKGKNGAVSLTSYDGAYKIVVSNNQVKSFDENIHIAKQLLDEYLTDATAGASQDLVILVQEAFRMRQGYLDFNSIMKLTKLNIKNEKFKKAIDVIKDSIVVYETAPSFRVYRKEDNDYKYIPMDFSTLH